MSRGQDLAEGITLNEGTIHGVTTKIIFQGEVMIVDRSQDMEAALQHVAEMRERNALRPFASDRELGHIPELFYGKIRAIQDKRERNRAVRAFFRENPAFCACDALLRG